MLPLVITVEQVDGGARRYAFADSPISIGRSPFAELQLSEPFISRWEGTLRFDADEITYFSLGSTNSTYLNGAAVAASEEDVPVQVDSVLTLGELSLRFAREPVPESDLRRKGKRRPTRDDAEVGVKTVYLDAAQAWALTAAAEVPAVSVASTQPALEISIPADPAAPDPLASERRAYREARASLVVAARAQVAELPASRHAAFLDALMRSDPALASEPELQSEFHRAGVSTPSDIPELREWLRAVNGELLPENVYFDSRLTLTRVLGLVEALVQSLAEIHDAQDSVRRRWLGRGSRRSILQSDKGNIVLAYLLNPQADWNERLRELEQSVRDVVTHEFALFRAVLEGARTLVDAISPEVVEQSNRGADVEPDESSESHSFWTRLFSKTAPEVSLWRRFVSLHADILDGARYERVFLGRVFARSYLAAMGQVDSSAR